MAAPTIPSGVILGIPDPSWINSFDDRALMVSHNRLRRYTPHGLPISWPKGAGVVIDSGAYSLITKHGAFPDSPYEYAMAVRRYSRRIGNVRWAAIQDYPCEGPALKGSGLTVERHQVLTAQSWVDQCRIWPEISDDPNPFKRVLQGDGTPESYQRSWQLYTDMDGSPAGADIIGVGSVCTIQATSVIADVVDAIHDLDPAARLHGYGVKGIGLQHTGGFHSVDSQAEFYAARRRAIKDPRCTQMHRDCRNCPVLAESWHDKVSAQFRQARAEYLARRAIPPAPAPGQTALVTACGDQ